MAYLLTSKNLLALLALLSTNSCDSPSHSSGSSVTINAKSLAKQPSPALPTAMPASTAADPFPTKMPYKKSEWGNFIILDDDETPDTASHYHIFIPRTWGQVKLPWQRLTLEHSSQLQCHVQSLTGPAADINVQLIYTQQEMSPQDVLTSQLAEHGERVLRQELTLQPGGVVPDVLTVRGEPGKEQISRWKIAKNADPVRGGAYLFVVRASTAAADYTPEMAKIFYMAVGRFAVLHPTSWPYAEQLRTLVRTVPTKLALAFPLSWDQIENPLNSQKFYQVQLTKKYNGRQIGHISLITVAGQTLDDMDRVEHESRTTYAKEGGLEFEEANFEAAPSFGGLTNVQVCTEQQLNVGNEPAQERHVLRGQAGSYWVYIESIHPTSKAAPDDWAICKQAFAILQEHLTVKK